MIHETQLLFVAWQCPDPTNRAFYPVARLTRRSQDRRYEFAYVRGVREAIAKGFVPFFGPRTEAVLVSDDLPAFLANRVMSPQRPDYRHHIESLGLGDNPEPISVLARTEGTKVTDNIEVFAHPLFDAVAAAWVYYGFCRGIRHVDSEEAVAGLRAGDQLVVEAEFTNKFEKDALLLLRIDSKKLGYVPRTLIEDLNAAIQGGHLLDARVERVNPPPAPVQQRMLARYSVPAMDGFRPLSTDRYQPVSPDATQITSEDLMRCG